jgi:subtilisin-like proprotein convertase family protein
LTFTAAFSQAAPNPTDLDAKPPRLSPKELASMCALLDDPKKRALMDSLELRLLVLCGRTDELGRVRSELEAEESHGRVPGTDTLVNNPIGETGPTQTQSETSIAINETTGTLCSGYNDSFSGFVQGMGYTGFSRSIDGGLTYTDRGALSSSSFGDPSIVWRKSDGVFYFASLHSSGGLGIWRSVDDCSTFQSLALGHTGFSDDKELLAVDNNPGSPFFGRLYLAYTDFAQGGRIFATHSDNGTTWTTPVVLSAPGDTQGAYPVVAPDGTVYVGWVRWNPYFSGPINIEIARSTNGGQSFALTTNPATSKINPFETAPTNACGRPALHANIRYLPSPQLAVSPNGNLHVVYSYDPDGRDVGDVVNVYYRRSTDQGQNWQPEIQLNDDGTTRDQFFPTVSAGPTGRIVTTWYDRRLDAANTKVDYFARVSDDGGATWGASERISDVSSPIYLDPNLNTCYHGDYDQQLQTAAIGIVQWADDRAVRSGHNDPDTYVDRDQFTPDFTITPQQATQTVCAPSPAVYDLEVGSVLGFADPVTLTASGNPPGTNTSFSLNPVVPPGTSTLTIGNTGSGTPGNYSIDITGTSGALVHDAAVSLSLATTIPGDVALSAPADGATNQALSPTFSWSAATQAGSYAIDIASDPGFANVVDHAEVTTTSYTTGVVLGANTTYYWRVQPINACGDGAISEVFSFTTVNLVCRSPALPIPDSVPAGVNDSMTVSTTGVLTDLNVSLDVTHTFVGDLAFTLTHVDTGTSVVFVDRPGVPALGTFGCGGDDIDATLDDEASSPVEDECAPSVPTIDGTFIPNALLAAFDGEDLSGTWRLNASDNAGQDVGTLNQWCLAPSMPQVVDTDADGIPDDQDNCTLAQNNDQRDTDGDGIGNICDADFDETCTVNFSDLGIMKANFFQTGDLDTDMNGDGFTNFSDLALLKAGFFGPPGPSGVPNDCD